MNTQSRGRVSATFGERTVDLALTFNALCDLEEIMQEPASQFLARMMDTKRAGLRDLRALLWACMRDACPGATLKDAGALAGEIGHEALGDILGRTLRASGLFAEEVMQSLRQRAVRRESGRRPRLSEAA